MATIPDHGTATSSGSLNLAMATLAAGSLAFLTYAMPDDIFAGLVTDSGLPNFLAAAEPPLGMKARAAAVAGGALIVFAAVLLLFRGLDRLPARARGKAQAKPEAETDAPRIRRADAHPDAPSRRPLLAGRDLGEFVEADDYELLEEAQPEQFADLVAQPLPGFLAADEPEPTEVAVTEPPAEPLILDQPQEEAGFEALVAQLPDAGNAVESHSITDLMRRLETGLSEREQGAAGDERGPDRSEPEIPSSHAYQPEPPIVPMQWEEEPAAADARTESDGPDLEAAESAAETDSPEPSPLPSFLQPEPQPLASFPAAERDRDAVSLEPTRDEGPDGGPDEPVEAEFPPIEQQTPPASLLAVKRDRDEVSFEPASDEGPEGAPDQSVEPEYPPIEQQQVGHRLRAAIGGLQKLAGHN